MEKYFVNRRAQENGDHEVHRESCVYLPITANRLELGNFWGCVGPVEKARGYFTQVNGCKTCCNSCHTS